MIVRQASPDDAEAIARISNRVIAETLITFTTTPRHADDIRTEIMARGPAFLVLEQSGEVTGFATYGPFRGGPGYAATCEHSILLDPEVQGQGGGRRLLRQLETTAAESGCHVMVGGISSANPAGIAFHKAMGFVQVGQMPEVGRKNGQWLDLILMQKILTAA